MNDESIIRQYNCKSRAKSANKRFNETIDYNDVVRALKINDFKCFYCNDKIDFKNWQLDHFFPRANGGKNESKNIVACCKWCNTMKNALDGHSFINKCSEIISNNFFVKNNIQNNINDKKNSIKLYKIKKTLKNNNVSLEQFEKIKIILNTFY